MPLSFTHKIKDTEYFLLQGDITHQETDAIVNAANGSLMGGGGVDGAIHAAGGPAILEACKVIRKKEGECLTGHSVITTGGKLKAKYVIHTVGPVWQGGMGREAAQLKSCYVSSLALARANKVTSLSFPSVSTGVYRFPIELAAEIAQGTVIDDIRTRGGLSKVGFVLFDSRSFDTYLSVLRNVCLKAELSL